MRDYVFDEQLRKRVAGPAGFTMSAVAETALPQLLDLSATSITGFANFCYLR